MTSQPFSINGIWEFPDPFKKESSLSVLLLTSAICSRTTLTRSKPYPITLLENVTSLPNRLFTLSPLTGIISTPAPPSEDRTPDADGKRSVFLYSVFVDSP